MKFEKANAADLEQIVAFRRSILHPDGPIRRVIYPEDLDESTLHYILKQDGSIEAAGTLIDEGSGVHRIRGMAVSEELRGQGVGSELVDLFISFAKKKNAKLLWCNGRLAALALYEKKGFVKAGDAFEVPGSGPHYRLELRI